MQTPNLWPNFFGGLAESSPRSLQIDSKSILGKWLSSNPGYEVPISLLFRILKNKLKDHLLKYGACILQVLASMIYYNVVSSLDNAVNHPIFDGKSQLLAHFLVHCSHDGLLGAHPNDLPWISGWSWPVQSIEAWSLWGSSNYMACMYVCMYIYVWICVYTDIYN